MPSSISDRLQRVQRRIRDTALDAGRDPRAVTLLAVSKTHPVDAIQQALAAGQRDFGENYLQDALPKIAALQNEAIIWHFIGPVQANKTRSIARYFDWVHSVDRLKVAKRLSAQRRPAQRPLQLCLQVNISREPSKNGLLPEEVADVAGEIANLPNLTLRGLMGIPQLTRDPPCQRAAFAQLRQLLLTLQSDIDGLDTLSMGMSGDLEAAILEGATLVRIGTDIFGARIAK